MGRIATGARRLPADAGAPPCNTAEAPPEAPPSALARVASARATVAQSGRAPVMARGDAARGASMPRTIAVDGVAPISGRSWDAETAAGGRGERRARGGGEEEKAMGEWRAMGERRRRVARATVEETVLVRGISLPRDPPVFSSSLLCRGIGLGSDWLGLESGAEMRPRGGVWALARKGCVAGVRDTRTPTGRLGTTSSRLDPARGRPAPIGRKLKAEEGRSGALQRAGGTPPVVREPDGRLGVGEGDR